MTEAAATPLLQPDLDFKRDILGLDAHDLTSCYQCGTCSVVCPISPDGDPFPRKEMIWVQWGLKDRLMGDAAVWLCHQCSLCNTYCPRDAKPANVMAALREYSIAHYAVPAFMGRAVSQPRYLFWLLAAPALIFLGVLFWVGNLTSLPAGQIVFSKFVPILYIEIVFTVAVGIAIFAAVAGGKRYWSAMAQSAGQPSETRPSQGFLPTLGDIFGHVRFRQCEGERVGSRESHKAHLHRSHMVIFYGFLGLVVTTTSVAIGIYAFGYLTPWPFWHPVKILGNVSGVAVLAACGVFIYRRLRDKEKAGKSTYGDWLFLCLLGVTTATGFLAEIFRNADIPVLAYPVYFVHLVLIFLLLVYLPYSKLAHLIYRFVAMLYAAAGRATAR